MLNSQLVSIVNQTNLHVGTGSEASGILDNMVHRDYSTKYPGIPGSGLKGALREMSEYHFENINISKDIIEDVFGSNRLEKDGSKFKKGGYYFQDAFLLSYPFRGEAIPYFNATCPDLIRNFLDRIGLFKIELSPKVFDDLSYLTTLKINEDECTSVNSDFNSILNTEVENKKITKLLNRTLSPETELLFGQNILLANDNHLSAMTNDFNLPFIARNHLNHGKSENLFYEQIVPKFTHFYSFLSFEKKNEEFEKLIKKNSIAQIGANASIGYGWCKINLFDSL